MKEKKHRHSVYVFLYAFVDCGLLTDNKDYGTISVTNVS